MPKLFVPTRGVPALRDRFLFCLYCNGKISQKRKYVTNIFEFKRKYKVAEKADKVLTVTYIEK